MTFNVKDVVQNRIAQQQLGSFISQLNADPLSKYKETDFTEIEQANDALDKFVENVANASLRGLIVTGPPGVGKTSGVTRLLQQHATGPYKVVAGHMSVIELYCELYRHRNAGEIIVLDDVDSAFKTVEGINVVKAASDTIPQRRISWATASPMLQLWGIDKTFDYNGGIILISNETQRRRNDTKIGKHIAAISDRLHTVCLGSNDKDEQFNQLCYHVIHHGMLRAQGLTPDQERKVLDYIAMHFDDLERISLRTALKIAELMLLAPDHWRSMANLGVLNSLHQKKGA